MSKIKTIDKFFKRMDTNAAIISSRIEASNLNTSLQEQE